MTDVCSPHPTWQTKARSRIPNAVDKCRRRQQTAASVACSIREYLRGATGSQSNTNRTVWRQQTAPRNARNAQLSLAPPLCCNGHTTHAGAGEAIPDSGLYHSFYPRPEQTQPCFGLQPPASASASALVTRPEKMARIEISKSVNEPEMVFKTTPGEGSSCEGTILYFLVYFLQPKLRRVSRQRIGLHTAGGDDFSGGEQVWKSA